ncbi:MAG TPA: hypothetical protein VFK57_19940 [Vicinamibacterales bacterium]|nr:hypothetical protein [Vicinamibacterales bacterium]
MRSSGTQPRWRPALGLMTRVSAAGAIAGGFNAWLCYAQLPRPVTACPVFTWEVVPAGALHGGVLAFAGIAGALWAQGAGWPRRVLTAMAAGWLGGYVSWHPLRVTIDSAIGSSRWPFDQSWDWMALAPLAHFGLVAAVFCLAWPSGRPSRAHRFAAALAAGIVGSLWWWISYEQWYLSPLHGAIWGAAVAVAAGSRASVAAALRRRTAVSRPVSTATAFPA